MTLLVLDESKAKGYVVVAAMVPEAKSAAFRRSVDDLRMRGQRRLHFSSESPSRRREILAAFTRLGVEALAYRAQGPDAAARGACLRALVGDLERIDCRRLVLEQDDSIVAFDRQLLYRELRVVGLSTVTYEHERATSELLLAIPDALAWCITRGGVWRQRANPMLQHVRDV